MPQENSKASRRQYRLWLKDPIPKPPKSTACRYKLQENKNDQVKFTAALKNNDLYGECSTTVATCNLDPINSSFNTVCSTNDEMDTVSSLSSLCSDSVSDEDKIQATVQDTSQSIVSTNTNNNERATSPSLLFPRPIKKFQWMKKRTIMCHEEKHSALDESLSSDDLNLDDIENEPPAKKGSLARLQKKRKKQINNIRSKTNRLKLNGRDCWECEKYYKSLSLSESQLQERKNKCSRHRSKYERPHTPEGFWDPEFPETSSTMHD